MVRQMIGSKGGSGGSSFVTKPDTLRSNDSFEILLGLGSGRWKGLVNGLQSFKINGVPLENEDGTSNFENVFLIFADGNPLEDQIVTFKLGGGGNAQTVNTQLANANASGPGGWVSGAVLTPGANFIDLRFVVQQLFYQDKKGVRENTATIEIEMRPSGTTNWINIFTAPASSSVTYDPNGYDYYDSFGGVNNRIYLSRSMFNTNGVGFKAGNGQGMAIKGKTSSPFVKEIRVSVPNAGAYANKSWEVRARLKEKDTVDADEIQERRNIIFESITAINNTPLGDDPEWDGLVWAQVHGKASDQFNGFPELTGIFDTKICKVPPTSIFNPTTRAYTGGTWDGSYVEAFTRDPAWQIKEFVEDPIHGVAGLYPGATVDKWDALEASKYYSQLVPDGQGGMHPRFSMNLTINEAKNIDEMMQYLAGAVNSYTEEVGEGVWRLKVDKPETPVMVFTEDNVFGEFSYSHSPIDTRFNDWRGTFLDETLDYETNTVRVFDQADIDANGTKFTEVALIGCTNPQEALRRLMYRLRVSLNEYKAVTFTTNRVGRLISPLNTILVADGALNPNHLVKSTSRLHSYAGTNVSLKRPIRLQAGVTYKMKFTTTDLKVVERTITNVAPNLGDVTNLTINSALPNNIMPESAVALEAVGLAALPVAYRVVSVEKSEDNEDEYTISAVFIDVGKWDAMDNVSAEALAAQESSVAIGPPTVPSSGMFHVVEYATEYQVKKVLQINWNRPASMFLDGFRFEYRLNNGPWRLGAELLKDSFFELQNPQDGTYEFKITALDRRGVKSNPLIQTYVFDGDAIVTPPAHIRGDLADRPDSGPYDGFRYTATDGEVPITYVWNDEEGEWEPESNLITEGSQIGVENGATVGMTPAEEIALQNAQNSIDELFDTYGDTAAAAASATAAAASATAAETAEANSQQARDDAQDAFAAADAARILSQAAASSASGSASAAAGSAGAALVSKTDAETAASAAQSSRVAANLSLSMMLPDRYDGSTGQYFTLSVNGDPASVADAPSNATAAGYGPVRAIALGASAQVDFATRGVVPAVAGRIYEIEAEFQRTAQTGTAAAVSISMRGMDSSYGNIASGPSSVVSVDGSVQTLTAKFSDTASSGVLNWVAGAVWLRPYFRVTTAAGATTTIQVRRITTTDVTEREAAAGSASAAASSASTAATKATEAGVSASAAAASETTATTAAGTATTKASEAATSATNAAGSAVTASSQATLSANSATAAQKAAQTTLPSTFEDGALYFASNANNITAPQNITWGVDPTYGAYGANATLSNGVIAHKARIPCKTGQKFKVRALLQHVSGTPATPNIRLDQYSSSEGATYISTRSFTRPALTSTTPIWDGDDLIISATVDGFVHGCIVLDYASSPGAYQRCYALELIDVDVAEQAAGSASAAATSASTASTKATEAGVSATAANSAKVAAETAQSGAASSASAASGSAATASSQAAAATTQAGLAAGWASTAQSNSQTKGTTPNGDFDQPLGSSGVWAQSTWNGSSLSDDNREESYQGRSGVYGKDLTIRRDLSSKQLITIVPGRYYKVKCSFNNPGVARAYAGLAVLDENKAPVSSNSGRLYAVGTDFAPPTDQWTEYESYPFYYNAATNTIKRATDDADVLSNSVTSPAKMAYMYPLAILNYTPETYGSGLRLDYLFIEDITESYLSGVAQSVATSQAAIATSAATAADASAASASANQALTASYAAAAKDAMAASYPRSVQLDALTTEYNTFAASAISSTYLVSSGVIQSSNSMPYGGGMWPIKTMPLIAGLKVRITATLSHEEGASTAHTVGYASYFDASGAVISNSTIGAYTSYSSGAGVRKTVSFDWDSASAPVGTAFVRLGILTNRANGGAMNSGTVRTYIYALYLDDISSEIAATAQAGIATAQAAIATSNAAAAQASAVLSASIGQGSLNRNPGFDDYPSATVGQLPTNWLASAGTAQYRVSDPFGGYSIRVPSAAGANAQIAQTALNTTPVLTPNGWYVIEVDAILNSGAWTGAGAQIRSTNSSGTLLTNYTLVLSTTPTITGSNPTSTTGVLQQWRKLVQVTDATAFGARFDFGSHLSGGGSNAAANDITFQKALFRAATPSEIRDQTVLAPMEASVSSISLAVATLQTRTASYVTKVSAGSGTAELALVATDSGGNPATTITLKADKIKLGSITQPALEISGGKAIFSGELNVGATSGARVRITQDLIEVYDSAGTRRVRLGIWT